MTSSAPPHRVAAFDILNVLACISVVALHVNGDVWAFGRNAHWLSCMAVQVVCYWAVPIFVMLTGATLMDYRERYDTRIFFKKRLIKTAIPFLAWSFIAMAILLARGTFPWDTVADPVSLWNYIMSAGPQPIYWFFPMIWGMYLCIPALSLVPAEQRKACFGYLFAVSFVFVALVPQILKCFGMQWPVTFPLDGGYVIYLVAGYLLTQIQPTKKQFRLIYAAGIGSAVLMFVGEVHTCYQANDAVVFWQGYLNFPCVLMSIAVFSAVYYHDWSDLDAKAAKMLECLSSFSFGVYLVHFFLIDALNQSPIDANSWFWRTLGVLVIYAVSCCIVWLLKRVPVLRKIVP